MAGKQCKPGSQYQAGRPAKMAQGGVVEGCSPRKGMAMGGQSAGKTTVVQTPRGFQRKK